MCGPVMSKIVALSRTEAHDCVAAETLDNSVCARDKQTEVKHRKWD
jgi:hypothetical protein